MALYGWLLLLPAAILLATLPVTPRSRRSGEPVLSATSRRPAQFVGIDNYRAVLDDPVFWQVAGNKSDPRSVTIPVAMALAMHGAVGQRAAPGPRVMRIAYFTPTMLPMIAAANIGCSSTPRHRPDRPDRSARSAAAATTGWASRRPCCGASSVTIWKEAGFFMIFYLAALQGIPPDLPRPRHRGGRPLELLPARTLPLLMPTTLFVLINALINAFSLVDHLFILTKGGPNNATNLILY